MNGQEYIDQSELGVDGLHDEKGLYIHIDSVIELLDDFKKQLKLCEVSRTLSEKETNITKPIPPDNVTSSV